MVVSNNPYTDIDLVVADDGTVHAAGALDRRIWWVTNKSGRWTRAALSRTPRGLFDVAPTIAMDGADLFVAYERQFPVSGFGGRLPDGVYYVQQTGGRWSAPEAVGVGAANSPAIAAFGGYPRIAYVENVPFDVVEEGDEFPLHYATRGPGGWDDVVISPHGTDPTLDLTSGGKFRICYGDDYEFLAGDYLRYVETLPVAGGFTEERIPGTRALTQNYACAVDGGDLTHIVYAPGDGLVHARYDGVSWSETLVDAGLNRVTSMDMAIGPDDVVHVVATTFSDGAWYFTNRYGAWESHQVLPPPPSDGWYQTASAIDVDAASRAHMLILVDEDDIFGRDTVPTTLYYAAAPIIFE